MDQFVEATADEQLAAGSYARGSEILLGGGIEPVKVSLGYKLGLVVVTFAMILLPLIYLALVALFGYGVYYHATENLSILSWHLPGRLAVFKLLAYGGPLVIGTILLLFMIKPLFAPQVEESEPYSLSHAEAPQLFNLIGQICQAMNAPIPSRIDLDCTINAAAGFRSGWRSFFGNDVMLTLGMPLVAGLTMQELAGVLAHEFGHFAQGAAMRLSYVVRRTNGWLARVVYDRDAWDIWLIEASEQADLRVGWIFYVARLGVWFSRRILWVLAMVGHGISSFMLRQMEYDADRYQMRVAGSAAFVATIRHLQHLNLASANLVQTLRTTFKKERKLYDNLPELVLHKAQEIPAEAQARLHSSYEQHKTRWFDSHPCDADRVQRAQAANKPGILSRTESATALFANFSDLAQSVTLQQYWNWFEGEIDPKALLPVQPIRAQMEHDYAADQQRVKAYFRGVATSLRPIRLPTGKVMSFRSAEALIADLEEVGRQLDEQQPTAEQGFSAFKNCDAFELALLQAKSLIETGISFDAAEFGITEPTLDAVEAMLSQMKTQRDQAVAQLAPFEETAKRGLLAGLQLLRLPQIARHLQESNRLQDDAQEMLWFLGQVGDLFDLVLQIRTDCTVIQKLCSYRETYAGVESFSVKLNELAASITASVNAIQERTASMRYPFPHAASALFVGGYLKNKQFHPDPIEMTLREGTSHFEQLIMLYYRALAQLVAIAEEVEKVVRSGAMAANPAAIKVKLT